MHNAEGMHQGACVGRRDLGSELLPCAAAGRGVLIVETYLMRFAGGMLVVSGLDLF